MLHDSKGFTLLEILVALSFLAVVLVAVTSLPITTLQSNSHARNVAAATNLALDKIETLRGSGATTLTGGYDASPLAPNGQTQGVDAIYSRRWVVTSGPTPGTREVAVTVAWNDRGTHDVTLRALFLVNPS